MVFISENQPNKTCSNCLENEQDSHFSGWTASPGPRDGVGNVKPLGGWVKSNPYKERENT